MSQQNLENQNPNDQNIPQLKFSEHMWDKFEFIKNRDQEERKQYEQFINIIDERANIEEMYKNGLQKLNSQLQEFMQVEGNFANVISALKSDQANRITTVEQIVSNLRVEVVQMGKEIIEKQNSIGKKNIQEGKKLEKDLSNLLNQQEKAKQKYLQGEKQYQNHLLITEISNMLADISFEKKSKNKQKAESLQKEVQDLESNYKHWLKEFNGFIGGYQTDMKAILDSYQQLESERSEKLHDNVTKCLIFEVQQCKSIEYDINSIIDLNNLIDVKKGVQELIEKNKSNQKFYETAYFKQYHTFCTQSVDNVKRLEATNVQYQKQIFLYLKESVINDEMNWEKLDEFMNSIDGNINQDLNVLLEQNKILLEFFQDVFVIQQNTAVEQYQEYPKLKIEQFAQYTKNSHYLKRSCVKVLEYYRWKNCYNLNTFAFSTLSSLINVILDQVIKEKDTFAGRKILLLSFYFNTTIEDGTKITLLSQIENHQIWRVKEFWEGMIFESIHEELKTQKSLNYDKREVLNDIVFRERNIIFSQMSLQAQFMLNLNIRKKETREILIKFAKYYALNDDLIRDLTLSIDAFLDNSYSNNHNQRQSWDESDKQVSRKSTMENFLNYTQSSLRY